MPEKKKFSVIVFLSDEERQAFQRKRRKAGLTVQGLLRNMIVAYIQDEEEQHGRNGNA